MFATSQGLWKMRIWNLLHENVRCDLPFPRLHVWMKLWWSPPWCKCRDLEDSSNIKNKEQRNELTGQILRSHLYCWQYLVNTFSHNDVIKNKLTFFITLKHLRVSIPNYSIHICLAKHFLTAYPDYSNLTKKDGFILLNLSYRSP